MLLPLVPLRCSLYNPFPPLVVTAAVCGVLLLLQVSLLTRASAGAHSAALPRRWLRWARPLVLFLSAGVMLVAAGLSIWMWLQSNTVVPVCSFVGERVLAEAAAYRVGALGVLITVIVTVLLLLLGLALVLLSRWSWRRPQRAAA